MMPRTEGRNQMSGRCPFTGGRCDGGETYPNGTVGCGYKATPDAECKWLAELPDGASPRDFYNQAIMEESR